MIFFELNIWIFCFEKGYAKKSLNWNTNFITDVYYSFWFQT